MLTTKQLRELISKHNTLSKITIPARATRPQLIKLIEGQGYKVFEEQGKIVGGPKRIIKPDTPSKKEAPKKEAPKKESSDFKMSARDRRDLIFQWELWWRRNGGLGLRDYMIMPARIANAAFKNQKDIDDKKRREGIFQKLQQLIGDGNMYDGTTWKTITKKYIETALKD